MSDSRSESSIARPLAAAAQDLAIRIDGGATLWAVAPRLDDHAQHLAVEFLHPASVGACAVPAVAVPTMPTADLIDRLRSNVCVGDVIISMGAADVPLISEISIRCRAWGVGHLHIGWSLEDQTLTDLPNTRLIAIGSEFGSDRFLTRAYHLLWELTFVCLQRKTWRSGLPVDPATHQDPCAVCSDDAVVVEVESLLPGDMAAVRSGCGVRRIDVSLVPPVQRFDLLLTHAGMALQLMQVPHSLVSS